MKPQIICTLGTTTDSLTVLEKMIGHGMSCARLNTAYSMIEEYEKRIGMLKQVSDIPVMMDLKGPQVRLMADRAYTIHEGDILYVGFGEEPLHFSKDFYRDVHENDRVYIENGTISTVVCEKKPKQVSLLIEDPGEGRISRQMGVNIPGAYLCVPRLSPKDKAVIEFSIASEIDAIALSFVRRYRDIENLQSYIERTKSRCNSTHTPEIVAKIEDIHGLRNIEEIIAGARNQSIPLSIMIGRGDLDVELPKEEFPLAQEHLIATCKRQGMYVITATGILESMQQGCAPTRAELNDVLQAVRQGTNAFMLSGETSNGKDPVAVVRQLSELIERFTRHDSRYTSSVRKA